MNLDQLYKLIVTLSVLAFLASCAPTTSDLNSYQTNGTEESNIVGGTDSTLEYAKQNGVVGVYDMDLGALCTGNLIGDGLVLSAGHCVNVNNPTKMIVFFGTDLDSIAAQAKQGHTESIRRVVKVIRHEKYQSKKGVKGASQNDISLIRFQGPAVAGFKTVTMATSLQSALLKVGASVSLAGYGLSEFKQDPKTGQELASKGAGLLRQVAGIKVVSMLSSLEEITLDQSQGHGACHGDSGGPAYLNDSLTQKSYLIGVTSRGGGNCDQTAVYTGVIGYANWIQENSKQLMK